MNNYTTSVVVLGWNHWDLTRTLVRGLVEHEAENITELIIVDNGSDEAVNNVEGFPVHRLPKNIGFTLGANHGLRLALKELASRHLVFLISNDVQIKGGFIAQAADVLLGARRAFVGNKHINFDSGWNKHGGILFDYLEGWFLAATSDAWRDLNFFDENYAPFDVEDIDLSTTAKSKGYKLVSLNNPNVLHQGGGTLGYTPERRSITERNIEYFKRKWLK